MSDEEYDILVSRVLAGEASLEEKARLEALLARDEGRRSEFEELKASWEMLREFGPAAEAMDAPMIPLPEYRLAELQGAVRRHSARQPGRAASGALGWIRGRFGLRQAIAGSLAVFLVFAGLCIFVLLNRERSSQGSVAMASGYLLPLRGQVQTARNGQPVPAGSVVSLERGDEITLAADALAEAIMPAGSVSLKGPLLLSAKGLDQLARSTQTSGRASSGRGAICAAIRGALFQPLKPLLASGLLATTRDAKAIPLYCPREATSSLEPVILWKAEPGKTYDLTITDELDRTTQPWQLRGAVSPLQFGKTWTNRPLARDHLYRLTLREAGNPLSASEYTFRTLTEAEETGPGSPSFGIARAYAVLTASTSCPGDALAELLSLPPPQGDSEFVLRMKLLLFGQLALADDYQRVAATLTKTGQEP